MLQGSCSYWVGADIPKLFPGRTAANCANMSFVRGEFGAMAATPGSPISSGTGFVFQAYSFSQCRLLDAPTRDVWEVRAAAYFTA